mgnify:CR=1 FL=1
MTRMKHILTYLQQLNFSKTESLLYVLLLQNGPLTVKSLAEKAKRNRTAVYPHINSLIDKSIFIEIIHDSRKKLVACEPERLGSFINNQLNTIQTLKTQFPDMLASLNSLFPEEIKDNKSIIKSYKGIVNARKIYEDSFNANEIRAYAKINQTETLWPDNTKVFNDAFKKNKQLKMWEIIYGESAIEISEDIFSNTDRYFYKFMPNLKLSSEDILMYDGKVAIINFRGGGASIVLQSADFYNNLKELFDFMWDLLSEPKEAAGKK